MILDDEPLAIEVLETYIDRIPELSLVSKCTHAMEANEVLRNQQIDLLFLDIQMPKITGIEFLKALEYPPFVVIVSAYPDYAVEGFDLNVIDYLLKPVSFERFLKAVNKVSDRIKAKKTEASELNTDNTDDFIFVKADKRLVKINFDDIIYIEGLKDYVIVRMDNSRVITLQTMKSLEDRLPGSSFKRIHRSYIVNLKRLVAISGNQLEVMESGKLKFLPIGKNYKDELLHFIQGSKL
jgi:DNA-binding LytR/AlgR family response regulator